MDKLTVVGLREEIYTGKSVQGHNCDFEYVDTDMTRSVILLKDTYGTKYELSLWDEEGECGSGWCTASWGCASIKEVELFAGKTHKPTKAYSIEVDVDNLPCDADNSVFVLEEDGGDSYYPCGFARIKEGVFEKIEGRGFDKRPVLIFYGDSNCMKSHISALTGKSIYETDYELSVGNLPEKITQDIVVVGNKHKVDIEDIKSRLQGCEVIEVNFKRSV